MAMDKDFKRLDFDHRPQRQFAVISKLVPDPMTAKTYGEDGNRKTTVPPMSILNSVSDRTASVVNDLDSMSQLLPDIELAAQILVSSILSPKDMGAPKLQFSVDSNFSDDELAGKLIKVISDYFTDDYKINETLSDELHNMLFDKGAYIQMVLPESSLDAIINEQGRMSLESVRPLVDDKTMLVRPLGILPTESSASNDDSLLSLESMMTPSPRVAQSNGKIGTFIHVVDNPDAVKLPKLYDRMRHEKVKSALGGIYSSYSQEARKKKVKAYKTDRENEQMLNSQRGAVRPSPVIEVKRHDQTGREMFGHPMVMTLPTEAVIPAHVPSRPEEHIGYFILLDQYGNPLNTSGAADHYRHLQSSFQKNTDDNAVTQVINELRGNANNFDSANPIESIAQATNAFADIIERNLLERIRKGLGNGGVELARPNDVYQIMLARTCRKKYTQVLFVPSELMSYMAFYYTKQGVGKSLLEESRILASMRVLMMFTNTMASIRNSTPRTELGITFDPLDADPMSTAAMVKDAFMRTRAEEYPLGEGDPNAVIRYLQRAGVDVVYSNHEGLPDMRVETNDKSSSRVLIDRDLEEQLRHRHIMSMGLSPETIDMSANVDFATTLVNSNLMLSKRVALYASRYESMKAKFIKKFTENSEPLLNRLKSLVEKHAKGEDSDEVVERFINAIEVALPKPDYVTLESQMQAFESYTRSLEQAIEAWVSGEFSILDGNGDLAMGLDDLRTALKAHFQRKWLRENNVFPELEELTSVDDKGDPLFKFGEVHGEHMDTIMAFIEDYLVKVRKATKAQEERLRKEEEKLEKKYGDEPEEEEGGDASVSDGLDSDATPEEPEEEGGDGEGELETPEEGTEGEAEEEPSEEPEEPEEPQEEPPKDDLDDNEFLT